MVSMADIGWVCPNHNSVARTIVGHLLKSILVQIFQPAKQSLIILHDMIVVSSRNIFHQLPPPQVLRHAHIPPELHPLLQPERPLGQPVQANDGDMAILPDYLQIRVQNLHTNWSDIEVPLSKIDYPAL